MADVPIYQPSIQIQAPGLPQVRAEPRTPASAPTNVAEAAAGVGKEVEHIGAQLEQHMVMQEKLKEQQEDYATTEAFKSAIQDKISDPDKGLLVKNQGVNAPNIVPEYDKLIHGTPGQPGRPGTTGLIDQFLNDKSPYQQARLSRTLLGAAAMYRGKLINHALEQKEAADQAITEAKFDSEKKDAALITTRAVQDPATGNAVPAITLKENEVRSSVMNDINLRMKGTPEEKLKQIAQDHVDEVAKIAVEANAAKNWQDAQKILDSSSASPTAKLSIQNHINGARIDQYTEALTKDVVNTPEFRAPDGQIDESKAQSYIQKQIAENEAADKKHPLPPGHGDAIIGKLQSQIAIQNKAVAQRQQLILAKTSNDIWGAQQAGTPPAEAYDKFIKQGQFDNAIERGKAEDIFTKVYQKDPSALDAVWNHMTEAQKTAVSAIEGRKDFIDKFSYPDEKRAFIDSLKQRIIEGRVQSPDAINELYMKQIEDAATGAPRFFFQWTGKQMKPQYQIDEALQQNQPLIKALGGLTAATQLAQSLGGPGKLAPDTNESKAAMILAKYGKPINASTISTVITKHPELLK